MTALDRRTLFFSFAALGVPLATAKAEGWYGNSQRRAEYEH